MKKKIRPPKMDFDAAFDKGDVIVDFSNAVHTKGLTQVVKLPPITIPAWLAVEIETLSQLQANSKASVVRQLLVEAVRKKKESA